jgi:HAD superfamily hydrolase (TIGR01549 family)
MLKLLFFPKAIIFDVDGTLYNQNKLRRRMFSEMFKSLIHSPKNHFLNLKMIWDFRKARARNFYLKVPDLDNQQYIWGAQVSKVSPEKVRQVIIEWMERKPLRHLEACRYQGVMELFCKIRECGILIGIFSDYPARDKLEALGLSADVIVSATSKEINRLKPDPMGLRVAAMKLQTPVDECLFIGDQDEKDGECARRASMPYLILKKTGKPRQFARLHKWIEKC